MDNTIHNLDYDEGDDDYVPNHFVPPFNTATGRKLGNFTTDVSKVESYINEISKTEAAILSLTIVDGMSRNAISLKMPLITKSLQNGSSQGIEEFWEPHPEENGNPGSEVFEATDVNEPVSIDWEVYRYGWGYECIKSSSKAWSRHSDKGLRGKKTELK
ncbi:hypothetical protein FACUT_9872 [Fusarium acutatum]|uniref:Uncharacterized protein n=1 Tax=Fusarium acutatum TaxID=78861 RepID=A0A8H4JGG2_9HYPO|nr:hypothetical protein FACUT_9872 [Fusarium acutatum]